MEISPKVVSLRGLIRQQQEKALATKCPPAQLCPMCNGPSQWVSTAGALYCLECYPPVNSASIRWIVLACLHRGQIVWSQDLPHDVRKRLGLPVHPDFEDRPTFESIEHVKDWNQNVTIKAQRKKMTDLNRMSKSAAGQGKRR